MALQLPKAPPPGRTWHCIRHRPRHMQTGGSLPSQISLSVGSLSLVGIQLLVQARQHGSQALMLRVGIAFFLLHVQLASARALRGLQSLSLDHAACMQITHALPYR